MVCQPFRITRASGETIIGDLRYQDDRSPKPVVVICHSFMAFKDWGWFPFVAERIAEEGFATVAFNFSRNGIKDNPGRITDYEAFRQNTISLELEDLHEVMQSILRDEVGSGIADRERVALLGHSRGGGLAIITAARSRDVKALVTWSSVSTFDRWTMHQKEEWQKLGYLPLARDTAASPLKLGIDLLNDVENNREKLDIVKAASKIRIPWLLVHGTEDVLVRFSEAERLYAAANKSTTKFVALEKVGHTYGGAEVNESSAIHHVVDTTINWLKNHL